MPLLYSDDDIRNGLILPDSDIGKQLGLTSDKFHEGSYLWFRREINTLYISMLISKHEHQGNVLAILQIAANRGYKMEAVSVSTRMTKILIAFGFQYNANTGIFEYHKTDALK